jgi:hypothetical protein
MVTNWLPAMAAFCVVAGPALAPRTVSSGWTFHHARFELTLPEGWQVADFAPAGGKKLFVPLSDPSAAEHTEVVHFAHASGAYFTVFVDHGTEVEFDAIWEVKEGADGSIQIVREGEFCRPLAPETLCTFGNGSLEIATHPALRLHGVWFGFQFGSVRRETGVNLEPFRTILRSFRARTDLR